jgi:hypothetical protein
MKPLLIALAFALMASASEPRRLIVALGPEIPLPERSQIADRLARLLYEGEARHRVTILDALRLREIADVTREDSVPRLRQQRHAREIAAVFNFVKTNSGASLNVPAIFDEIGRQMRPGACDVLVIGSGMFHAPTESLDLRRGWPSDGHLSAGKERSILSTVEHARQLDRIGIHWMVTDLPDVLNESHRYGLERFWSLFVGSQGGVLATYSGNFRMVLASALAGRRTACNKAEINPFDAEVVLHSRVIDVPSRDSRVRAVTNVIFLTNSITVTNMVRAASVLPRVGAGKVGIGIVWGPDPKSDAAVDLDLYVVVPRDNTELFYRNTTSAHGRYFRDIRQSQPGEGTDWQSMWEFVELDGDQVPSEIWINLFSGTGPVSGEVRVQQLGQDRVIPFSVPTGAGNYGANAARREQDFHWVKVRL